MRRLFRTDYVIVDNYFFLDFFNTPFFWLVVGFLYRLTYLFFASLTLRETFNTRFSFVVSFDTIIS